MQKTDQFSEVFNTVNDIFRDVLEDDKIVLKYETTSADVEEWDSLNHIALVVAIEKQFGIQFTAKQIQDFKNVGEMCDGIVVKLQSKV